jgi:hypothetical protein
MESKMKCCSKCKSTKPTTDFGKYKGSKDGLSYWCKSCRKEDYNKKRESILEKKKLYYQENKDVIIPKVRAHYKDNREEILAKKAAYLQLNKDKSNKLGADKRARKRNATPSWLTKEQKDCMESFYWMAQDLKRVTGEEYHVDHIVPLKGQNVCGLHVPWNLQVLPSDVNIKKGNKYDPDSSITTGIT